MTLEQLIHRLHVLVQEHPDLASRQVSAYAYDRLGDYYEVVDVQVDDNDGADDVVIYIT